MQVGVIGEIDALARKGMNPHVVTHRGKSYLFYPGTDGVVKQDLEGPGPQPEPLKIHTLTGLVDYLKANRDGLALEENLLHVVSHENVRLISMLDDDEMVTRQAFVDVSFTPLLTGSFANLTYGTYYPSEDFNIALQAFFEDTPDLARVLAVVGTIAEESVRTTGDNGVTQTVTARAGIVTKAEIDVPNPVTLRPFRTFREVPQPSSKFILRLKGGGAGQPPACALFEADGGRWKLDAVLAIAAYLRASTPDTLTVVA